MIVIIEGIDRVGKTTLCNMIHNELNIPIHKYKGIVKHENMSNIEESDKTLSLLQLLKETNSNIIFDRTYFTDYVYGVLERNYDKEIAYSNFCYIDVVASKMDDVFLIYVVPTDINESSNEHGKDLSKYNDLFYDLFKDSKIKNKWRCTYNTLNEAILFIKSNAKEQI